MHLVWNSLLIIINIVFLSLAKYILCCADVVCIFLTFISDPIVCIYCHMHAPLPAKTLYTSLLQAMDKSVINC